MRWIACLMLGLVVLGYVAARLPSGSGAAEPRAEDPWRHTADGWERRTRWAPVEPGPPYPPHPATVAALIVLLSVTALVAFPCRDEKKAAIAVAAEEGLRGGQETNVRFGHSNSSNRDSPNQTRLLTADDGCRGCFN